METGEINSGIYITSDNTSYSEQTALRYLDNKRIISFKINLKWTTFNNIQSI